MEDWVFSLGVLIVLFSALALLIPEGKTGNVVKLIFSSVIVLLLFKPILNYKTIEIPEFNDDWQFEFTTQEDYMDYIVCQKITLYQTNCEKITKDLGINDAMVTIEYSVDEKYQIRIVQVIVLVKAIDEYKENEQKLIEQIKNKISKYLILEKDMVKVYGK